ncbi:MAG: DUF429 domain-containing protein [Sulfurifustis sp.]
MDFVGVDGCRSGWFYLGLSESGDSEHGVVEDDDELAALAARAKLVLIDVPIGLKERGESERSCDVEARRVLGRPRASSVFRVPTRQAVEARSFETACAENYRITGTRLSRQTWNICDKIRQIDRLLRAHPMLRSTFHEMHPEVCFWGLSGGRAASHNKKSPAGRRERIEILAKYLPNAEAIADAAAGGCRRKDVAWDDILDAFAGAVTARVGYGNLSTLPANPERDERGLAMEVVFARPGWVTDGESTENRR